MSSEWWTELLSRWWLALGALALALAAPIIIHLRRTAAVRVVPFAALSFVRAAERLQRRQLRWLHVGLLLNRIAIVCALLGAVILPQPWAWQALDRLLPGLGTMVRGGKPEPMLCVVLLDCSLSMAMEDDGYVRFDLARRHLLRTMESAEAGNVEWGIVLLTEQPRLLFPEPQVANDVLLRALNQLRPTHGGADPRAGFAPAREYLSQAGQGFEHRYAVVYADFQTRTWEEFLRKEDTALNTAAGPTMLICVDVGKLPGDNRAISQLNKAKNVHVVGEELVLDVATVAHHAQPPSSWIELHVQKLGQAEGNVTRTMQSVPVAWERASGRASLRHVFNDSGTYLVEAWLRPDDALPVDNVRSMLVQVREALTFWLVAVPEQPGAESRTRYLREALGNPRFGKAPEVLLLPELRRRLLAGTQPQAILLCDLPEWSAADATMLRDYVARGGHVVVVLGPHARAPFLNQIDWLPVRLLGVQRTPQPWRGQALSSQLRDVTSMEDAAFEATWQMQPKAGAETWLQLQNSEAFLPWVVSGPWSLGRVTVVATSMDRSWSDWPLTAGYLVYWQELLLRVIQVSDVESHLRVGEPWRLPRLAEASLRSPLGTVPITAVDQNVPIIPEHQGLYELEMNQSERRWDVANLSDVGSGSESDPRRASAEAFQTAGIGVQDLWSDLPFAKVTAGRFSLDGSFWLLGALMPLLMADVLLMRRRSLTRG